MAKKNTGRTTSTLIPLYLQISESISREIAAGRYSVGDRLPPERDLAAQFDTTVRTLRKSLATLEEQGMLERVQGSGNYVRASEQVRSIYSMFRLELHEGGGLPTAKVLSIREMKKARSLPAFGRSLSGTRVRRLRYLDEQEIAVEEIWLDKKAGTIIPGELGDSLYRYYQVRLKFFISHAEDRVSVDGLPDWAPDSIKDAYDGMYGYIERLSWAQEKQPVEFSRTWFNPHKAHYVQRLK